MVWPFSSKSSSSDNKDLTFSDVTSAATSALDTIEHTAQDARARLQSTKASLDEMTAAVEEMTTTTTNNNSATTSSSSSSESKSALSTLLGKANLPEIHIPPSVEPYLIATLVFGVATTAVTLYKTRLRRIPTSAYLTPNTLQGKRTLKGKVTSVGDSDNFRFYHTPGGIWAGWGWLRHVPSNSKENSTLNMMKSKRLFLELKNQTLHIRIAGVDAPEGAHFGMPAQPFSQESLAWLRQELIGKTVLVKPYAKDRYDRVNVSKEMLRVGYGQIYRQAGSEYGGILSELEKIEAQAKSRKIGIWSQKTMVSAADHKKQYLRGGE
ncbi:putative endonuclease lcl3 [Dissophora globulifera]|uniref:Endonuclease lcl3 n=1 Tax=Dissophora globulifera TaxID=979702 RepID=A0A9P6RMR4_9FUNG|nr:putative endonuclease lcl3 [Dissophora globulifera]